MIAEKPTRVIELAVKGMLPKGPLGRDMYRKLRVYAGPEHRHSAPTAHSPHLLVNQREPADGITMADNIHYGTGRRKTATARVFLAPGSGRITINRRPIDTYFGRETARHDRAPAAGDHRNGRPVRYRGHGSRRRRQRAGGRHPARRHAGAHPYDESWRAPLRRAGFVTRDAREVERKKVGLHKARKRPQYSKR